LKARFFLACALALFLGAAETRADPVGFQGEPPQVADYEARLDEILDLCRQGQLPLAYQRFTSMRDEGTLPPAIERFLVSLLVSRCSEKDPALTERLAGIELEFGLGYSSNLNRGPSARGIFIGEPGNVAFLEFSSGLRPRPGWFSQVYAAHNLAPQGFMPSTVYGQFRQNGMPGSFTGDARLELGADWWRESGHPTKSVFQASRLRASAVSWGSQGTQAAIEWLGVRPVTSGYTTLRSELRSSSTSRDALEWLGEFGFGFQKDAGWSKGRLEAFTALGYLAPVQGSRPGGEAWFALMSARAGGGGLTLLNTPSNWALRLAYQAETDSQPYSPGLLGPLKRNLVSQSVSLSLQADRSFLLPEPFPGTVRVTPGLTLQFAKTSSAVRLFSVTNSEVMFSLKADF
jgi:hypothetical protein